MTEPDFAKLMRAHFESLFPKTCRNCQRQFPTLREYILICKPAGQPISYDADMMDWSPANPIGAVVQANCPCGNTLALGTQSMPLATVHMALDWIRVETVKRGLSAQELLGQVRTRIRERIVSEPAPEALRDGLRGVG
jgi:hypothetical protein